MSAMLTTFLAAAISAAAPVPEKPKAEDGAVWPAIQNPDFKLTAELVAEAKKDAKGVLQIANNQTVKMRLKSEKDCEIAIYWLNPKGAVVQLFPNRFDRDVQLKAGKEREFPSGKDYDFVTTPTAGEGIDRLHVVAITGALPAPPRGEEQGPFIAYRTDEARKELIRTIRGVVIRDKAVAVGGPNIKVSQAELQFRVSP